MKITKQIDVKDCGLHIVQGFYKELAGKDISINELKLRAEYNEFGINLQDLMTIAEDVGLVADAYNVAPENLSEVKEWVMTVIKREGFYHYVIFKVKKDKVHIIDPIDGKYKMKIEKFKKMFGGLIVIFERGVSNFEKITKKEISIFSTEYFFFWPLAIVIILEIAISFISAIHMKVIIDTVIPTQSENTLLMITFAFVWVVVIKKLNQIIRSYFQRKLSIRTRHRIYDVLREKILNIKYEHSSKLTASDLYRRFAIVEPLADYISDFIFTIFNDVIIITVSAGIMIWLSPSIFALPFSMTVISLLVSFMVKKYLMRDYSKAIDINVKNLSSMMDMVTNIGLSKYKPAKRLLLNNSIKNYSSNERITHKIWSKAITSGMVSGFVYALAPILIIYVSTKTIFNNEMSVGDMMLFINAFGMFSSSASSVFGTMISYGEQKKNIELINFVLSLDFEEANESGVRISKIESIEVTNFRPSFNRSLFKLNYLFDENTKLIGANGAGKSTLLKYLSLRYIDPDIKFSNLEISEQSIEHLRNKLIYINSDDELVDGTVLENITFKNKNLVDEFNANYQKLKLGILFSNTGLSIEQPVINHGENLSSGQKQLVKILRLFTAKKDFILLDEAFENIDKDNFKILSKMILTYHADAKFIEVSHSGKFVSSGKVVNIEKINGAK